MRASTPPALEALHQEIAAGKHGFIDDLLVIRHGAIVAEHHYQRDYERAAAGRGQPSHQYNYYDPKWHPYVEGRDEHTLQSVTKSVTSALIGIAIGRGEIPGGVGSKALALLADRKFADPDGRKASIELADLLTMRAGFAWDESRNWRLHRSAERLRPDGGERRLDPVRARQADGG